MLLCQTLWTGTKDLLEDDFGWLSPQHHLMCWALSSHNLKKYYKDISLHSDNDGIEILISKLQLPYTNVYNDFSNLKCPSELWALPKLLTYGKQQKSFLHIDGDVLIWDKFPEALLRSPLIAQNLEIGTDYYESLLLDIKNRLDYIPGCLKKNLHSKYVKSYNAGIIGGNDLFFYKNYVEKAIKFIYANKSCWGNVNYNIVFEQLLLYSLASQYGKKVNCYFNASFDDNKYMLNQFANFPLASKNKYLHIIGPLKKNLEVCNWLSRVLYKEHPDTYLKIIQLYKRKHYYYSKIKEIHPTIEKSNKRLSRFEYLRTINLIRAFDPGFTNRSNTLLKKYVDESKNFMLKELFNYETKLKRICQKYKKIDNNKFKQLEVESTNATTFFLLSNKSKMNLSLITNPYISIIYNCFDWTSLRFNEQREIIIQGSNNKSQVIAVVPEMFFQGYRDVFLDQLSINIIILLNNNNGLKFKELLEKIATCFTPDPDSIEESKSSLVELMNRKIKHLLTNKIVYIKLP